MWDWDRNEKMGPWKWKGKYLKCTKPLKTMIYIFRLASDFAKEMIILVVEKEKSWMTSVKAWESK